jgi:CrcB protein
MLSTALVFLGAGIGGVLRHGVNVVSLKWLGASFPYGTMAINILGSGVMGIVAGWLAFKAGEGWTQPARLFLTTGVLGGFTTFSTYAVDIERLVDSGHPGTGLAYLAATLLAALTAVWLAATATRRVLKRRQS